MGITDDGRDRKAGVRLFGGPEVRNDSGTLLLSEVVADPRTPDPGPRTPGPPDPRTPGPPDPRTRTPGPPDPRTGT